MVTKKAKSTKTKPETLWPRVVKGSHLTVEHYEDGTRKLIWDDEKLMEDVRNAIATVTPVSKV